MVVIYSSSTIHTIHNSTTPVMYSISELNNVCTPNITFEDPVLFRASKASRPTLTLHVINCGASELLSSFVRGQCPRGLRSSLAQPNNML